MRTHDSLVAGVVALATMAGPLGAQALAPDTSWVRRSALYEVFVQDFSPSGDFRGVIAGLDRIQSAGADVVWLMPIHPIGEKNRKGTLGSPTRRATTAPSTPPTAPRTTSARWLRRCTPGG